MSRMLSEGAARPNADERQELGDFTATRRLLILSAIAICLGAIGAVLALVLLRLIAFFTNIFFYGRISFKAASLCAFVQPPCSALSRNLSITSWRVSGSCAPPRK